MKDYVWKAFDVGHNVVENFSKEEFFTLSKKTGTVISKTRIVVNGYEIDIYDIGLVTIEKEYSSVEEALNDSAEDIQPFVIKEITGDKSFSNKELSKKL